MRLIIKNDKEQEMYTKYREHVDNHRLAVEKAFNWLLEHKINEKFDFGNLEALKKDIKEHDASKYSEDEFAPYAQYFNSDQPDEDEMNVAWNLHQKRNKHHWQFWVLIPDDRDLNPYICLPMDNESIVEMICDWWSFSWTVNRLDEIFNWYDSRKEIILLHQESRAKVEQLLSLIKEELNL